MAKLLKSVDLINFRICNVAMWTVFFLMFLTTIHAILRKFTLLGGIRDALPITELAMVVLVFCGFAYMQSQKGHVRVDFLVNRLPRGLSKLLEIVTLFIGSGIIWVMFYASITNIIPTYAKGASTMLLKIPFWPFMIVISVGLFFYALTLALHAIDGCIRFSEKPEEEIIKDVDLSTQI